MRNRMFKFRRLFAGLAAAAATMPGMAAAATLQISPVMIELQSNDNASGITLQNPGDTPVYGQVRVFRWDQVNGEETLTPTRDLIASPPLMKITGQDSQLIRLVRESNASPITEQSFRILIDELAPPGEAPQNGVTIRLRYSVPVFIEPAAAAGSPRLSWHLRHTRDGWTLNVENAGTRRAQIAAVRLVNAAGKAYVVNPGLLGYALAGRSGQWTVALPPDVEMNGAVKVRATVNSVPLEAVVTVDQSS
ncbi:fimbrial chaperone protein [Burkholderia multivorans]